MALPRVKDCVPRLSLASSLDDSHLRLKAGSHIDKGPTQRHERTGSA